MNDLLKWHCLTDMGGMVRPKYAFQRNPSKKQLDSLSELSPGIDSINYSFYKKNLEFGHLSLLKIDFENLLKKINDNDSLLLKYLRHSYNKPSFLDRIDYVQNIDGERISTANIKLENVNNTFITILWKSDCTKCGIVLQQLDKLDNKAVVFINVDFSFDQFATSSKTFDLNNKYFNFWIPNEFHSIQSNLPIISVHRQGQIIIPNISIQDLFSKSL